MNSFRRLCSLGFFLFIPIRALYSQALAVDNVRFVQQANSRVTVTYDLVGDPAQKYNVALSLYLPDSKNTVALKQKNLEGATGKNVGAGRGQEIVWDLLKEYPRGLNGDGYVFVVDAFMQQKGGSKTTLILGGLAAAAGGTAYYLTTKDDKKKTTTEPDLPGPPRPPN